MSSAAITRGMATAVLVFALAAASWAGPMDLSDGRLLGEGPGDRAIEETIWFQGYVTDSATGEPKDIRGYPRKLDGDDDQTVTIDMGAYELNADSGTMFIGSHFPPPTGGIIRPLEDEDGRYWLECS